MWRDVNTDLWERYFNAGVSLNKMSAASCQTLSGGRRRLKRLVTRSLTPALHFPHLCEDLRSQEEGGVRKRWGKWCTLSSLLLPAQANCHESGQAGCTACITKLFFIALSSFKRWLYVEGNHSLYFLYIHERKYLSDVHVFKFTLVLCIRGVVHSLLRPLHDSLWLLARLSPLSGYLMMFHWISDNSSLLFAWAGHNKA